MSSEPSSPRSWPLRLARDGWRAVSDARTLRALIPGALSLLLVPWVVIELDRELAAPLFRDAMMSQYTGWCIRHGMRLYGDVGAPDGPFIHFLHALFQIFVGIRDHGARVADLTLHVALSFGMGMLLAPRCVLGRGTRVLQGTAWGLLGVVAWLSWYMTCGWEHTVQRDPIYAVVGYFGLVLLYVGGRADEKYARIGTFVGGAILTSELFTRQSGAVYPFFALIMLWLDDHPRDRRLRMIRAGLAGALACVLFFLVLLLLFGDVRGFWFWYFRYPLESHRFIGKQPFWQLFTHNYEGQVRLCAVLLVWVTTLSAAGMLPRKSVVLALVPLLFLVAACAVGKGWMNHVQQVEAAANVVLLVTISELWGRRADRRTWGALQGAFGALGLSALLYLCATDLRDSQFNSAALITSPDAEAAERLAVELRARTKPDDRVLYYAHEAHGLLYAERKTAIPYYVDMVFNIDAFMKYSPPAAGIEVPAHDQATFAKLQADIAADACGRLKANHPAAIVIKPNDLGIWSMGDPMKELGTLCPELPQIIAREYRTSAVAGFQLYYRAPSP